MSEEEDEEWAGARSQRGIPIGQVRGSTSKG